MNDHPDAVAADHTCTSWKDLVPHLEEFPLPATSVDLHGEIISTGWVFRGQPKASYQLEPSIEREAAKRAMAWAALESLVTFEFRSRAHMHLEPEGQFQDELTRLAVMRHRGIPTRLLDFTYSPFVALYFAIRNNPSPSEPIRLWAIDSQAVNKRFRSVAWRAHVADVDKSRRKKGRPPESRRVSLDPDTFLTDRDSVEYGTQGVERVVAQALNARDARRRVQEESGCACVAAPPYYNPRLASQQGLFLINCAEGLTLLASHSLA